MTWSRFDDASRKHPKALKAGNEAWMFWCAAIMYSNLNLTDGFIADAALATEILPVAISKTKAKVLAERLVAARVREGGSGLFERAEGGYVVHDFLDWNPSKEEVEAKRRKDRDRKRTEIPSGIQPEFRAESERNPDDLPSGIRTDSASRVRPHGPPRGRPGLPDLPDPPIPPIPTNTRAPVMAVVVVGDESSEDPGRETVVPLNLVARLDGNGTIARLAEQLSAPIESVRDCVRQFVATWSIGKLAGQRRAGWAGRARQWVVDQHAQGRLKPPGAVGHEHRAGFEGVPEDVRAFTASVLGNLAQRDR